MGCTVRATRCLLPYLFFVVSGGCALCYEVVWARYLGLFLGNTTLSHMCVLAAYMGGLAGGSLVIGSLTTRLRCPLATYGWIEAAIGVYAVSFPFFIKPVQSFTLSAASGLDFGTPAWTALRLGVSVLVLVVPTLLMGGTFPVLMKHFQPKSTSSEDKAEWLYAANCGGAVTGALIAGFALIPSFGLSSTLVGVGLVNTALGALAIVLGSSAARHAEEEQDRQPETPAEYDPVARPVYAAIAVSGLTAMIYELVWIRLFAVVLGSSTYSFTLMLAAFITGITLGSLIVGAFPRLRANALLVFALAETAIGVIIIASLPMYERLPYVFWKWSSLLRPSLETIWLHNLLKYSLCFLIMAAPTIFFGMTLPLAIKTVARRDRRIGKDSGLVYGANTVGTLAGALLAGLLMIPMLGLRGSLEIAVAANLGAGFLLLWVTQQARVRALASVSCAVALVGMFLLPQWHPTSLVGGTFREGGNAPPTWREYLRARSTAQVLFYGEDGSNSVGVAAAPSSVRGVMEETLYIDGKADASAFGDMPTQVLLGQLPMLLRPESRDVFVIGLGSGVSVGSVLTHPGVRVDCAEISPLVAKAARLFDKVNNKALDDPRLNLVVEDARTVLASRRKCYDIIISEPTNPWVAGMGNLFSLEFFEAADRSLKPRGLIVQWFHSYETSDELVSLIIRSLRQVFPYAYVFHASSGDYIVVGSKCALRPDFAAMEKRMEVEQVKVDLERVSIDSPIALLGFQVLTPAGAARVAGEGPINRDDMPLLEYRAPRAQYARTNASVLRQEDERLRPGADLLAVHYLKGRPLSRSEYLSMIRAYQDARVEEYRLKCALLSVYVSRWQNDARMLREYARTAARLDLTDALSKARLYHSMSPGVESLVVQADLIVARKLQMHTAFTAQDFSEAEALIDRAIAQDPSNSGLKRKRWQIAHLSKATPQ